MTRAAIAKATLENIEGGGYALPDGTRVPLREVIDAAVAGTKLYRLGDATRPVATAAGSASRVTAITVTAETTNEAIVRLERAGGGHLAALNFASARNPGGGFLGGAQAQEEALRPLLGTLPVPLHAERDLLRTESVE